MKSIRRRTLRAILVPFALFVIVVAGALPASADTLTPTNTTPAVSLSFSVGPYSLNW